MDDSYFDSIVRFVRGNLSLDVKERIRIGYACLNPKTLNGTLDIYNPLSQRRNKA